MMYDSEFVPSFEEREQHLPSPQPAPAARGPGLALLGERSADPKWLLVEEGFTLAREHEVESLFAIGNGYIGNRGSLAEGSLLSAPATFAAGVFEQEQRPGAVPGLFVLPDWTAVRAWIEGQPLSMQEGEVLEHRRILDMAHGVLWREWRHRDPNGRISRIVSFRLASLADRHLLLHSTYFSPENYSGEVRVSSSIELAPEVVSYAPPEEWKTRRSAQRPNILPLALRSPGRDVVVAFAAASQLLSSTGDAGRREIEYTDRHITERFVVQVDIGAEYRLDRLVSVYTSRDDQDPAEAAVSNVNRLFPSGLAKALTVHTAAWRDRWRNADVQVEGDESLQRALRFAEYHLITAANSEDERVSIGARALTGESYKGHVFWDTEIYMVPFFAWTHPPSARALLMYRYHMLSAAREKARSLGYRGAMFPWESADTGGETTPRHVIAPGGEVIRVLNGEMELHIVADIAYAAWQYWNVSGDDEFFVNAGAELMLEAARFWASRGALDDDGHFHIRHVIGPDEYHEDVDDSAFTNIMAAWNMRRGVETAELLGERWPERWRDLSRQVAVTEDELASWTHFADAMYTGFDPQTRIFEQFRGYYEKEVVDLAGYEPRNTAMDVILGHEGIQKTNIVKQADVIMAMYLLWDEFPPEVREANFRYYEPRTGHGSSLSPSIHALVAARLGDIVLAEKYLRQAAEIDLGNNMGNAAGGVHAAAVGGLWQSMIFGFAGVSAQPEQLSFNPHLLPQWQRLALPLCWRGRKLRVAIEPGSVRVRLEEGDPAPIAVDGVSATLRAQQDLMSERKQSGWTPWREQR